VLESSAIGSCPQLVTGRCQFGASQVILVVKNLPANAGDIREADSIPGSGRFPGRGHGNLLQHSLFNLGLEGFPGGTGGKESACQYRRW